MTNNPNEFVIVPKVATDGMCDAMIKVTKAIFDDNGEPFILNSDELYQAATSTAPPHNLVAVDKSLIREVLDMIDAIHAEPANMPHSIAHLDIIEQLKGLV